MNKKTRDQFFVNRSLESKVLPPVGSIFASGVSDLETDHDVPPFLRASSCKR